MAAVLETTAISRRFGGVHAVDEVTVSFEEGSRVGIIGPNGAGKTTFFNLLGGQLRATGGRVAYRGRDITRLAPHRRAQLGIARSFQLAALFPGLTVEEQALLAVRQARKLDYGQRVSREAAREHAHHLLDDWDVPGSRRSSPPAELSYGEQRRLELALALASRPGMLLLDEPNVGLTQEETARLVERIRGLDSKLTVLIVAHDMDVVFGVADRVVVMHRGRVMADGAPSAIRDDETVAEIYFGGVEPG